MGSSRRTSVQRHIDNPHIHGGGARAVPFTEYSAGITSGKYKVGRRPSFVSPDQHYLLRRLLNKISVEFENEIAREIARRIFKNTFDESLFNNLEKIARNHIWSKQFKETFRENR